MSGVRDWKEVETLGLCFVQLTFTSSDLNIQISRLRVMGLPLQNEPDTYSDSYLLIGFMFIGDECYLFYLFMRHMAHWT